MANRYWVGGSGTWNSTATTKWSAASGISFTGSRTGTTLTTTGSPALVAGMTLFNSAGTASGTIVSGSGNTWTTSASGTIASSSLTAATIGASVPTASDNVFFDANSNSGTASFTITMADTTRVCNDLTITTDGVMTLVGTGIGLTVSGNLSFPATNLTRQYSGLTTFNATTTGKTITTNGKTLTGGVTFDGIGGGWTLGSALDCGTSTITLNNGTFDTGGYNVTAGSYVASSSSGGSVINLNSSTVTLTTGVDFTTSTSLTLNAGSSQINISSTTPSFYGGGKTFYNVAFTSTAKTTASITGQNTFNNLSVTNRTTIGITKFTFSANQTISGTFTVTNSTASAYRTMFASDVIGTQRTLTVNAISSIRDVDFRDIAAAGYSASWYGTRFGDCGGNSGINFDAAKTVYFTPASLSVNWGATGSGSWSITSGGLSASTDFPLAQDTAVINNYTSISSLTINANYNIGTVNSLKLDSSFSFVISSNPTVYGNFTDIYAGMDFFASGGTTTFAGRTTQEVYIPNTFYSPIEINSPTGTVKLLGNIFWSNDFGTRLVTLTSGTLNLNGKAIAMSGSVSGSTFQTATGTKNITFNGGTIQCTTFNNAAPTNFTTTQGTSEGAIELTSDNFGSSYFYGGGSTYNCALKNSGNYLGIVGSNTIQTISNSNITTTFDFGSSNTVTNWNVTGSAGKIVTIINGTLSKASGVVSSDYLNITNSTATGGATWYAGANSVNNGGNTGWIFTAPPSAARGNFLVFF